MIGKRSLWAGIAVAMALGWGGPAARGDNNPPVVSNVTASQRTDGSRLVDIGYDLADADGDACTVSVAVGDCVACLALA